MQDQIGSLKVGKSADMVAIDLRRVSTQPTYDPISQIVYGASREQISDVWVQGKQVVSDKKLTTIDLDKVLQNAHRWGEKIQQTNNK